MKKIKSTLKQLWYDEDGQDLTEYALLLVLLSLSAIAAMGKLATAINDTFSNVAANLTSAT